MADRTVHLKKIQFGIEPPGTKLSFQVTPAPGFAVQAILDCDTKVVATWEWTEISGGALLEEVLTPPGTYTLTLHATFTSATDSTVEVTVTLKGTKKTRSITARKPDIGRILAVSFIE